MLRSTRRTLKWRLLGFRDAGIGNGGWRLLAVIPEFQHPPIPAFQHVLRCLGSLGCQRRAQQGPASCRRAMATDGCSGSSPSTSLYVQALPEQDVGGRLWAAPECNAAASLARVSAMTTEAAWLVPCGAVTQALSAAWRLRCLQTRRRHHAGRGPTTCDGGRGISGLTLADSLKARVTGPRVPWPA